MVEIVFLHFALFPLFSTLWPCFPLGRDTGFQTINLTVGVYFFLLSLSFRVSKGENLFLDQQQWNQRIIYRTGKDKHFRLYKWNALWILRSGWLYSRLGYDFIKPMAKCSSYQIKGYVVVVLTENNITLNFTMKHYNTSSKFHLSKFKKVKSWNLNAFGLPWRVCCLHWEQYIVVFDTQWQKLYVMLI